VAATVVAAAVVATLAGALVAVATPAEEGVGVASSPQAANPRLKINIKNMPK
jgi:hypothetical protein